MKPVNTSRAMAIRISTELPSVPFSRARSNCFWLAPSSHLTMKMPAMDNRIPIPATSIGASTNLIAMELSTLAVSGKAAPSVAVARMDPQ